MPIYTENNGKKKLPRSIYIKILVFCVLVGISAVAMRPLQTALSMGISHIRTNLIERFETVTGMKIRYSSIRPSIFGSFDIRELRIIKDENAFLYISRVKISFSLPELLRGKKTAIRGIQIDSPSSRLDLERDREIIDFFSSLVSKDKKNENPVKFTEFFPEKADFRIRDCFFSLGAGKVTYLIQNMNIDIVGDGGELLINGKLSAEVKYSEVFNRTYSVRTEAGINGAWHVNLEEGSAEIAFSSLSGEQVERERPKSFFLLPAAGSGKKILFDAHPLRFALAFKEQALSLRTLGENAAYECSFGYNLETGGMYAAVNCLNFSAGDLVKSSDAGQNINYLLSLPVTGRASFEAESGGVMRYSAGFQSGDTVKNGDSFVIRAYGSEKNVVVDEFRFSSPRTKAAGHFQGSTGFYGNIGFSPFTPSGTIVFDNFSLTGEDYFNAVFKVSNQKNEIQISGETVTAGQCVFNDVDIFLLPSDSILSVIVSSLCEDGGEVNMEAILNYRPAQLEVSLSVDSFSAAYLAGVTRPFVNSAKIPYIGESVLKNIFIGAEIFIATDFNQIVYNAPNISVKTDDVSGFFSFSGTDHQFTLTEGIFTREGRDFLVSAHVNFSNPMDLGFSFNANYLDLSWHIEGQILDRTTLVLSDPNGLHVYGSVSSSGAVSGYLEGIYFPVPVNGQPVYLNFYIALRYTSSDSWHLDVGNFEAYGINSPNGSPVGGNYLKISGTADQNGASFRDLLYSDNRGDLAGSVDFSWDSDFSYIQSIVNVTDGREIGEYYLIEGLLKDRHLNINASVSDMRVDRFIKGSGTALVNGNAALSWDSPDSFDVQLNLTSLSARLMENAIQASARAKFTNDELTVSDLRLNYANINAFLPELQLSRTGSFAKMSADVQGFVAEKRFQSKFDLEANFKRIDSWVEIRQALDSIEGSLKTGNTQYGDTQYDPFSLVFAGNDGALSISGGPKNMLRLEMDSDGNFFTSLSAPLPIRSSVVGRYRDGFLDAHCGDFFIDLTALWAILPPVNDFNIAGGYITAKMDIRGPILNPEFFGAGRGSSFRLQVPGYVSHDIRPVPFNIVIEGNEMVFRQVSLESGGGGGVLDGWLRFENWVPKSLGLDITIQKETPIPYRLNIEGFLANGDASGRISINLENLILEINGDLFANNTELGMNIDEARNIHTKSAEKVAVIVNMTVTTGPIVEFFWPNTNMPILRANPEIGTTLTVFADSLTGQFSLNSDITIRSGELYYFDRSFYIRRGNLVFRETEQQFSPRLSARAEIRDRTDSGPVTISLIIENETLLSFTPRFEANPVLTQLEIYSLLGQNLYGVAGIEDADTAQRFIVYSATDLLAQFVVNSELFTQFTAVRQVERQIRNILHLDMFSVRTRLLQNAVTNVAVTMGQIPVDRNSRVGNYFDNTTVFIGKYVGQDMFIQGMLSMRYYENNADFGGLRFEPDVGIELQSPLFNIRWDFFPYHPENWWMSDNSITLTWSKSF